MQNLLERADQLEKSLLPKASGPAYEKAFKHFLSYCSLQGLESGSIPGREFYLMYFDHISQKYAPGTLWSKYSMLKACASVKHGVQLDSICPSLTSFLKKFQRDYEFDIKKATVFTSDEFWKFLSLDLPPKHLVIKVTAILGVFGALRTCSELFHITTKTVTLQKDGCYLVGFLPCKTRTSTKSKLFFLVPNTENEPNPSAILQKYLALIKPDKYDGRILRNWNVKAQAFVQLRGLDSTKKSGVTMAEILGLENPNTYTSHCFRRTAATISADNGASSMELMRIGRWKSESVSRGYVDASMASKRRQSSLISSASPPKKKQKLEEKKDIVSDAPVISGETFQQIFKDCSITFNGPISFNISKSDPADLNKKSPI